MSPCKTLLYNPPIDKNYVQMGLRVVRMSALGHLMRDNFVSNEKNELRQLIKRAEELALLERRGKGGRAEVVFLDEALKKMGERTPI